MKGGEKMHAITMLLQQMPVPKGGMNKLNQPATETESPAFQALLSNEQATEGLLLETLLLNTEEELNDDTPMDSAENIPEALQSYLFNMVRNTATAENELEANSETILDSEMEWMADDPDPSLNIEQLNILPNLIMEEPAVIESALAEVFSRMEALLSEVTEEQDIAKVAPKILKLLQQWSGLREKADPLTATEQMVDSNEGEETKEGKIARELIQTFQKREKLVIKQQYSTNAEVTGKDVSKWINKALNNQPQADRIIGQHAMANSSLPMSKLEQYVIHINESQTDQPNKQLMEQFQKVMKSSSFLAKPNGVNQLSITLRPNHLGEMMVRLTQIDGEMVVKITVSSHAAKKMLESNIHQLRNMFSPQQVVVERQELPVQQGQDVQREQKDQQLKDQSDNQSEHPDQQEEPNTGDDFATQFHELLMNEKV